MQQLRASSSLLLSFEEPLQLSEDSRAFESLLLAKDLQPDLVWTQVIVTKL